MGQGGIAALYLGVGVGVGIYTGGAAVPVFEAWGAGAFATTVGSSAVGGFYGSLAVQGTQVAIGQRDVSDISVIEAGQAGAISGAGGAIFYGGARLNSAMQNTPTTAQTAPSAVELNKSAGDSVRDAIAAREAPALKEQTFTTVGGVRRVDVLKLGNQTTAMESKVGRTSLGPTGGRVRQELARDWWLVRQNRIDAVRWEFTRSQATGQVGPTAPLQQKLNKLGFQTKINE